MIPEFDNFECEYCGKKFTEPIKIALHIGKFHDTGRGKK